MTQEEIERLCVEHGIIIDKDRKEVQIRDAKFLDENGVVQNTHMPVIRITKSLLNKTDCDINLPHWAFGSEIDRYIYALLIFKLTILEEELL